MRKTVVVAVGYVVWVPKYKVYERRVSRFKVGALVCGATRSAPLRPPALSCHKPLMRGLH